ncbi:MAG: recombination mediator RecR [Christensenellales bacterium]|jgi:recombination protein RecR|nr:recombination protein RecR [Clostridiales bacterium]
MQNPIEQMANELGKLPGIGRKSAQRLAYFLAAQPKENVQRLAKALLEGRENLKLCSQCGNFTTGERCQVCADYKRDLSTICVVKDPRDVAAMERIHDYRGLYHVLHGVLSPMDNIGPEDIRIKELISRLADSQVKEVIIATNPDIEGEATASYLARLIKPMGITVSRIAYGVPIGSDLEYADEVTLLKALEGRREM